MKPDDTPDNFWPEVCTYTLSNLAKKDQTTVVTSEPHSLWQYYPTSTDSDYSMIRWNPLKSVKTC